MAILFGGWKGDTGTDARIAFVGNAVSVAERVSDRREVFEPAWDTFVWVTDVRLERFV